MIKSMTTMTNIWSKKTQALVVIALILVGSTYWWYTKPKAFSTISGIVYLDEPIVEATISVYDFNGVKIFEEEEATHVTGSFVINVSWGINHWSDVPPDAFRIVATGGTVNNTTFIGEIARTVYNDEERDYYDLNAISTLVDAYLMEHPEIPYATVTEAVKDFLGVPEYMNLDLVIDSASYYRDIFHHELFMLHAGSYENFDAFIDLLVEEIDSGGQRIFATAGGGGGGPFVDILAAIAQGLAESLPFVGPVAGKLTGWALHEMGYKDTGARLEEISDKLDMVLGAVRRIETQINNMRKQLTVIQKALEQLEVDVSELAEEIELANAIAVIDESYDELRRLINQETVDMNDLQALRNSILDPGSGVLLAMNKIDVFVAGQHFPLTKPGILEWLTKDIIVHLPSYELSQKAWIAYEKNNDRTLIDEYLNTLFNNFIQYYETLENYFLRFLSSQVKGVNLIVEAYHFKNQTSAAQDYVINIFVPRLKEQTETFMRCVETLIFNAHPTLFAEFPNMGPIPGPDQTIWSRKEWTLSQFNSSRPYLAQIFPRADYLVDKIVKSFSGEPPGIFKARVVLSMLEPPANLLYNVESVIDFKPRTFAKNLTFNMQMDKNAITTLDSEQTPVSKELRSVTIYANSPSRWALPKAIVDHGIGDISGKGLTGRNGRITHTVPYGEDAIIYMLVFDFGRLPAGYYRLRTTDKADQVNKGSGWVMDREVLHKGFQVKRVVYDKKGEPEYIYYESYSWQEGFRIGPQQAPEVVIYIHIGENGPYWIDWAGYSGVYPTVINPWHYHMYDGYDLSTQCCVGIYENEAGNPYGYWGGYWRQEVLVP